MTTFLQDWSKVFLKQLELYNNRHKIRILLNKSTNIYHIFKNLRYIEKKIINTL